MYCRNSRILVLLLILCIGSFLFLRAIPSAQYPEAEITNGIIQAKIFLPDQRNGYYQGTRFDWSGVLASLDYKGHSYFGKWYDIHDPKIHDAITGPVEAFDPIGFEEANPGETFMKIGVGTIIKPDEKAYRFTVPFEVEDYGKWTVEEKKDQVEFTHELTDASGYSYVYHKNVKLAQGKPELVLEHSLKNTGEKKIETKVYNHNFFMIDDQRIGPDYSVTFPFDLSLKGNNRGLGDLAEIQDNKIRYLRAVDPGESVMLFLEGFNDHVDDYDIQIENSKTGAGVRIKSDQPLSDLAFWSIHTTLCPEPYTLIHVDPGDEIKWSVTYEYYTRP
jgi:hypothetical protein